MDNKVRIKKEIDNQKSIYDRQLEEEVKKKFKQSARNVWWQGTLYRSLKIIRWMRNRSFYIGYFLLPAMLFIFPYLFIRSSRQSIATTDAKNKYISCHIPLMRLKRETATGRIVHERARLEGKNEPEAKQAEFEYYRYILNHGYVTAEEYLFLRDAGHVTTDKNISDFDVLLDDAEISKNSRINLHRGFICVIIGRFSEARRMFREASQKTTKKEIKDSARYMYELIPKQLENIENLGDLEERLKENKNKDVIVSLYRNYEKGYYHIGAILSLTGEEKKAKLIFRKWFDYDKYNYVKEINIDLDRNDLGLTYDISMAIYRKASSKSKGMNIDINADISDAGDKWAVWMIKAYQYFNWILPKAAQIIWNYCTGDTPWMGYTKKEEWLNNWFTAETQGILLRYGIDISLKPDMKKVIVFPLDAIFLEDRDDYYSFANILNIIWERLGIPEKNRNFLYGDLIIDKKGKIAKASEDEYNRLKEDIEQRGILLDKFLPVMKRLVDSNKNIELSAKKLWKDYFYPKIDQKDRLQYRHMIAMYLHAKQMSKKILSLEGAHVFLSGVGPGYGYDERIKLPGIDYTNISQGPGHMGFIEAGIPDNQKAYIDTACYYVLAGHNKEHGGIQNMYSVQMPRRSRYGIITCGDYELLYRNKKGKDQVVVVIATDNNKSASVRAGIELPKNVDCPISKVQEAEGSIILTGAAANDLRFLRNPWDYRIIDKWTPQLLKQFFINIALDKNKEISKLSKKDFINFSVGGDNNAQEIVRQIRIANLNILTKDKSWEQLKKEVIINEINELGRPDDVLRVLNLKEDDEVAGPDPHMDDKMLAYMHLIIALIKGRIKFSSYYLGKGFTSVIDEFMFGIFERIIEFSEDELKNMPMYKDVISKLADYWSKKPDVHKNAMRFSHWEFMDEVERKLVAQGLFINLCDYYDPPEKAIRLEKSKTIVDVTNRKKLRAVLNFIIRVTKSKLDGAFDIELMCMLKTWIRFIEEQAAMVNLGVNYDKIYPPLGQSWYTFFSRRIAASKKDVNVIEEILSSKKFKAIIFNGESFTNLDSHGSTESGIYSALRTLNAKGKIKAEDINIMQYAGVWYRITLAEAGFSVILTREELEEFVRFFKVIYGSQTITPNSDSGVPGLGFFPDHVCHNSYMSKQEALIVLGRSIPKKLHRLLKQEGSGILNYKVFNLADPEVQAMMHAKTLELEKVRPGKIRASTREMQGSAPKVIIRNEDVQLLENAGVPLKAVVDPLEMIEKTTERLRIRKILEQWFNQTGLMKTGLNKEEQKAINNGQAILYYIKDNDKLAAILLAYSQENEKIPYISWIERVIKSKGYGSLLLESFIRSHTDKSMIEANGEEYKRIRENDQNLLTKFYQKFGLKFIEGKPDLYIRQA